MRVKVYDAIMGSGKTYNAIERMKGYLKDDVKFIYVTPFKTEINRVMNDLGEGNVFTPLDSNERKGGVIEVEEGLVDANGNLDLNAEKSFKVLTKRAQFLKMAARGNNIITTHALFVNLKVSDYELFSDYTLILDEVINPIDVIDVGAKDIQILKNEELILVDEITNKVTFIAEDYNDNAFRVIKKLCLNNSVYHIDKYFFVWIFPIEIFKEFKEIQILTYLFEGSLLSSFLKMYNLDYDIISDESIERFDEIKALLNIYKGKINQNFGKETKFSKSWVENLSKADARRISNSTSYIFKNVFNTKSSENAWTTFVDYRPKLTGPGYSRQFIAINSRATNDYAHVKSMAYLGNRFHKPQIINFFHERGVKLDQNLWALSELVQWIWRGCIRNNEEMNLFIPSQRMRGLLVDWLEGKYLVSPEQKVIEFRNVG